MYIRTKDGIFKVIKEEILCGVKFFDYETKEHYNRIREEHIIAKADSIPELSDKIVVVPPREKPFELSKEVLDDSLWREAMKEKMQQEGYKHYLSIWNGEHNLVKIAEIKPSLEAELI